MGSETASVTESRVRHGLLVLYKEKYCKGNHVGGEVVWCGVVRGEWCGVVRGVVVWDGVWWCGGGGAGGLVVREGEWWCGGWWCRVRGLAVQGGAG